jgi:hypothetical protein
VDVHDAVVADLQMRLPAQASKRIQEARDGQASIWDELQELATILAVFAKVIHDFREERLSS